ncbi:MAG: ParB/RepB/Spo0J family partition protein [Candidatus Competibacteraceae bacterium]|nr:ParB/RepB/Spo0J family partition protein [Candidatus Competibacteraceae bacterium]
MSKRKVPRLSDFIGTGGHQFDDSLLQDSQGSVVVHTLSIDQLRRSAYQPRISTEDDDALAELAQSIRELGVIEPIAVRPLAEPEHYEILAGDRRWRAARQVGLEQVPVIVHDVDDRTAAVIALVENLQRQDLNPMEEARALERLLGEFQLSQQQTAQAVGKSQSAVSKSLGLLKLAPAVQEHLQAGRLEAGHGKVLLSLGLREQQRFAELAITNGWSVRELEQRKKALQRKGTATVRTPSRDPDIVRLENRLQEWLGAPVAFKYRTSGKGRIEINFSSLDECTGILERLGVMEDGSD